MSPAAKVKPTVEIGSAGLKHSGGYIQEDIVRDLQGQNGARIYREMSDNSAILSASLSLLGMLMNQVEFKFEPCDTNDDKAVEYAEYASECLDDMSYSWEDTLDAIMTMLPYGYSPLEIVYKRRNGWQANPSKRSKFTDGGVGWRKLSLRAQESIVRWDLGEKSEINGLYQQPPPSYGEVYIPIEKLLLFRTTTRNNNPEGRSMLRGAYYDWLSFKRLTEVSNINCERDLVGVPVGRVPGDVTATSKAAMRSILENLRNHVLRANEQLTGHRELVQSEMDALLALSGQRMNEVMKTMTGWGSILLGSTLIAGIYGMNFTHMPELRWYLGYPSAIAMMLILTSVLYVILKKNDWL